MKGLLHDKYICSAMDLLPISHNASRSADNFRHLRLSYVYHFSTESKVSVIDQVALWDLTKWSIELSSSM